MLVSNDTMVLCLELRRKQLNRPLRLLKIACLLLLVCIISCSSSQGFAGVPSGKRKFAGTKEFHVVRQGGGRRSTLVTAWQHGHNMLFKTQMQTEDALCCSHGMLISHRYG